MSETTELTESILEQILAALNIKRQSLKFLNYSQNFVYAFSDETDMDRILRITSDHHRTIAQIKSEIEWLSFLNKNGAKVCRAIPNTNDEMTKTIKLQNDSLHCVIFEKSSGRPITNTEINRGLYFLHGASTGKLHRLAMEFKPSIEFQRFGWDENRLFKIDPYEYLPNGTKERIVDLIPRLLAEANAIKKGKESYGLIHTDLNYNNFFIDGNHLSLFDFDNCSYGYFAFDISTSLYNSIFTYHRNAKGHDHSEFVSPKVDHNLEEVWEPFWCGYQSENNIDEEWRQQIGLFFEIIHLKEFVHAYRHKIPYRNGSLTKIFEEKEMQILNRELQVSFDFETGKAISRLD